MKGRALVTGGAGFIGSFVAEEVLRLGLRTVVLDDLSGGYRANVPRKAEFVRGSVTDARLLSRLFRRHRFTHVYHLAAYAAEGLSHFIKRFNYEHNLVGSVNLINESVNHDVKCFVFTSSIAVYGANQLPMRESMAPMPEDSYGISKHAVESELKVSHEMFGLPYVIFRPHNVYGERQNIGDRYRNVIGIFMNRILQGQPLPIFGSGKQSRAFTYISDVAPSIARSPFVREARNQIFNIGSDRACAVNELAAEVCRVMRSPGHPVIHHPARNEVLHAYSNHSKARRVFGLGKGTPLSEGLERMARWARKHGARKSKSFRNIEITKNLPQSWREATR